MKNSRFQKGQTVYQLSAQNNNMKTDYGFDPVGEGKWRLVPSGEIVDKAGLDRFKSSRPNRELSNDIFGMSWNELERRQGGKLKY